MTWLHSRPRWQLIALTVVLAIVIWSVIEALPNGRSPYAGGKLTLGGPLTGPGMELTQGWSEESGAIHLEYQGGGALGVIIDGMDAAGTRGTITEFEPTSRTYADLATCTASFAQTEPGTIEGSMACPVAGHAPSDGIERSITARFRATR